MATISATVTQTSFADASKTFGLSDADMTRIIAAYQQDANTAVNGTATRGQVLNWIFDNVLIAVLQAKVVSKETIPAVPGAKPVVT